MSFLVRNEGKVHVAVAAPTGKRPLCGGGNGARKATYWQWDIGPANCAACERILVLRSGRERAAETTA